MRVINFCENCGKVYVVEEEGGISICYDCMNKKVEPPKAQGKSKDKKRWK